MANGFKTWARGKGLGAAVGLSWLLCSIVLPSSSEAGALRTYKVKGTVVAVTLNQTPPLIVVDTPLGAKNHMTVGATVTRDTKILRGDKRVALQTIKVGEAIWMSYVKGPQGVSATSILVKD